VGKTWWGFDCRGGGDGGGGNHGGELVVVVVVVVESWVLEEGEGCHVSGDLYT
jgi:hypothetical protein